MKVAFAVSSIVLLGIAAGCGSGGGGDPADIEDKPWQLTSATGLTIPDGVVPSAAFTDGNVFGTAGCNTYRASYTLDGDSLEIGEPAGTLIACPPPVDEFERAYLDALGQVASWELDGEELVLSDADGNELLRYEVASIVGSWTVTGVNTGDAVVEPDRRHGVDGRVRGRRIADGLCGLQQLHDVVHRGHGRHRDRAARVDEEALPRARGGHGAGGRLPRRARCGCDLRLQRANDGPVSDSEGKNLVTFTRAQP